ncbi:MAG TPA: elongation factor P maturation arginine rhamnosyltransferase EarP, partial [Albitalea sp.]
MLWDLFCRVVDNFGDVGVCWRAAADLASRGERVRLWIDDASALAWMAPGGQPGVQVEAWADAAAAGAPAPGDVVVEAF